MTSHSRFDSLDLNDGPRREFRPDESKIVNLPCHMIRAVNNDRTVFESEGLQALADSIRENGLQMPIVVRPCEYDPAYETYEIIAGERRYRAVAYFLEWGNIPAIVRNLSDEEASAVMLSENTGRKDLDPVDEAWAYHKRLHNFNWTPDKMAEKAGVTADRVRRRLKLTLVREDILRLVRVGGFPVGHAEALADLDHNRQIIAARPLIDGKRLNLREFRQVVDRLLAEQQQEAMFDLAALAHPTRPQAEPRYSTPDYPICPTLPPFETTMAGTGPSLLRYIETLQSQNHYLAAQIVGTVLEGLVRGNCARLPVIAS